MNQEQDYVRLIEQVAELQTSHDIDGLLRLFAHDAVFEDVALGLVAKGHAEIREMFEEIYAAMPDYAQTLASTLINEERGAAEWVMSGTLVNDYMEQPASGKSFSLRAAASIRFSQGRITHWTDYWSVLAFKEQVEIG